MESNNLTELDLRTLVEASIRKNGLIGHNIESYNEFMDEGIVYILEKLYNINKIIRDRRDQTEKDKQRENIRIKFSFTNISIGKPIDWIQESNDNVPLFPINAHLSGKSYSAPLSTSIIVSLTAYYKDGTELTKEVTIPKIKICDIPIMIGSNRCHTYNMSRESKRAINMDPNENGGYFIIKGSEWVIEWSENIRYNTLRVHTKTKKNERVRGEYISQAGGAFENSTQTLIQYMETGAITVKINSIKFKETQIPFYILFRLLAMTSDLDIIKNIVYDIESDSPVVTNMLNILENAINYREKNSEYKDIEDELDRQKIAEFLAFKLDNFMIDFDKYKADTNTIQYATRKLYETMDSDFLPHIGSGMEYRTEKLKFLSVLIHNTLLVNMGITSQTNRDSLANKRIHGAGISMAKSFKTQFNKSIVEPIIKSLQRQIKVNPFENITDNTIIETVTNQILTVELSKTLEQSITVGSDKITVRSKSVANRVQSQALERKNSANVYSALRTIGAQDSKGKKASKQTERAEEMRMIHSSFTGYICYAKSADTGEAVGTKKEMAITADICSAGQTYELIEHIKQNPDIIPIDQVYLSDFINKNLGRISVNGKWMGGTTNSPKIANQYRMLRRNNTVVDPYASIIWDQVRNEIEINTEVGRMTRPLLIVDNNIDKYIAAKSVNKPESIEYDPETRDIKFNQHLKITKEHIKDLKSGSISLEDLRIQGIIEWITPEESENCYIAMSVDYLKKYEHDVTKPFTHCDIQIAVYGITVLISPFGNHTQPARVTYETNQGRQSCGWFNMAHIYRCDKNRFFQYHIEMPLVSTFAYNYLLPNGYNTIIAYMPHKGYGQEDSATVSAEFIQRGGLDGSYYKFEKLELESKDESFETPDITVTKNMKPNASYEKLVNGVIKQGSTVNKGDVLIAKIIKLKISKDSADAGYKYEDKSLVYKSNEQAIVTNVYKLRGPSGAMFVRVKLRLYRPLGIGDKMSSRSGNKCIVAHIEPTSNLPYDEDGMTPDIIINPHSIPSRMIIGMIIETLYGIKCQHEGTITDGTSFNKIDITELMSEIEKYGFRHSGFRRMYSGVTGEYYDAAIFMGSTFHQRLQKFVIEDKYAVGRRAPINAFTGKPKEGKRAAGGMKISELLRNVQTSHGISMFQLEKALVDADHRNLNVCTNCGKYAVYNPQYNIYKCNTCGPNANISFIDSSKSSMAFQHQLYATGIKLQMHFRPYEFDD